MVGLLRADPCGGCERGEPVNEAHNWLDLLRCPADAARLRCLGNGTVSAFACDGCGREYPVVDGVPRFVIDEGMTDAQRAEMHARDAGAARYDAEEEEADGQELPAILANLQPGSGDTIVDLGCGTGRLLRQCAARAERVVGVDFSAA